MHRINVSSKIIAVVTAFMVSFIGIMGCSSTEIQDASTEEETISDVSEEPAELEASEDDSSFEEEAAESTFISDAPLAEGEDISYVEDEISVSDLFDTSGQIEETVLYDDNGVTITAAELVYSEESLDLILRVENNTDKAVTILNCGGGDGIILPSYVGEAVLYSESLGLEGAGDNLPVGTSDIALSYEMRQLIYSGLPCVPGILTTLYLYIWEDDYNYEIYEIDVKLLTELADDYLIGDDRFVTNTLGDEWAEAFGYTVLMSDTKKISDYCTAAALIEEADGDLVLLAEFSEDAADMMTSYCSLSLNGTSLDDAESLWKNRYGYIFIDDDWRFVYMMGISADDRAAYGLDDIETASLVYGYDGIDEYITLLDLAVSTDIDGSLAIEEWTDITAISMDLIYDDHFVGLKADGTVVAYGENENGRCNVGAWEDIIEVVCGIGFTAGLKSDGTVVAVGSIRTKDVAEWTNIRHIESTPGILIGITEEGDVLLTAYSSAVDLDRIDALTEWTGIEDVASNGIFAIALMEDGEVAVTDTFYDWSDWSDITSMDAGMNHVTAVRSDGTVVATGDNSDGCCNVSDWTDIVDVSAGAYSTVGVKSDGTLVVAGDLAAEEELYEIHDAVAVCVGNEHALVLHADGTVTLETP